MIGISLDSEVVETGAFVTGRIQWRGDVERRVARLLVAAQWKTDGESNCAWGVGRATQIPIKSGQHEGTFPFRLLIPHEGPISFQGELIAVEWKLHVRVDQSGFDESAEAEFRVRPRAMRG